MSIATNTPHPAPTAVIAGGGIAGAAAALLLARQGWAVTVLERGPRRAVGGARAAGSGQLGGGILLQPNGLAVLDGLGLHDVLHERAHEIRRSDLVRRNGSLLMSTPVPDFGDGLDHALALRRSDLIDALQDAVDAQDGITVIEGARVTSVHRSGTVAYLVAGPSGNDGSSIAADLVIGADGVHSAVRGSGSFGTTKHATGSTYGRGLVDHDARFDGSAFVGEAWTALGLFGTSPVGGATYFYADVTHPDLADALDRHDRDRFVELWQHALPAAGPILDRFRSLDDLLVNRVDVVENDSFVDGQLVLVGDAAHAMEPTLGQGANSALVDVAVLVHELARADDIATALRAYDTARRPAVTHVQRDAARLARMARTRSRIGRVLRDVAVRLAARPKAGERRYRAAQQIDPAEVLRWTSRTTVIAAPMAVEAQ